MAPYAEKLAIALLKEMGLEVEQVLKEAEHLLCLIEQLHEKYYGFIEGNPNLTCLDTFKTLEQNLSSLHQTCRFLNTDCKGVRHSIADCGVELN